MKCNECDNLYLINFREGICTDKRDIVGRDTEVCPRYIPTEKNVHGIMDEIAKYFVNGCHEVVLIVDSMPFMRIDDTMKTDQIEIVLRTMLKKGSHVVITT